MSSLTLLLFAMIPVVGGLGIVYLGLRGHLKRREMQHRERMAMIERGLIPPPETDPAAHEAAKAYAGVVLGGTSGRRIELGSRGQFVVFLPKRARYRSAGVTLIFFGLALLMILSFAANETSIGLGVGGAFAALGAGFLVNSFLSQPEMREDPSFASKAERPPDRPDDHA